MNLQPRCWAEMGPQQVRTISVVFFTGASQRYRRGRNKLLQTFVWITAEQLSTCEINLNCERMEIGAD